MTPATSSMGVRRITVSPAVLGGKPCIRDLRVTVGTIAGLIASGNSRDRIPKAHPYLEPEYLDEAHVYTDATPAAIGIQTN